MAPSALPLEKSTALITGASRGIGKALALSLSNAGAFVGIIGRRQEALHQVAGQITDRGGQAVPLPADVARPDAIKEAVSRALEVMGPIDILVNAAGIQAPIGPFLENDLLAWEHTIHVNLLGAVRMTHAVLPMMQARRRGKIINFSGGGATAPRPCFSAYAASKAALVRFTETLAVELEPYNIQVNAVAPGAVNTRMLEEVLAAGEKAGAEYEQALERSKSGGTPVDLVCELVTFLASSASDRLTGKLISAPHDPWRAWAGNADKLNNTTLYTLRRLDPFTINSLIKDMIFKF